MLRHRWNLLIKKQFHSITGEQLSPTNGRFWTQYGTGGSAVGSELLQSRVKQEQSGHLFQYNSVSCDYIACGGGIITN